MMVNMYVSAVQALALRHITTTSAECPVCYEPLGETRCRVVIPCGHLLCSLCCCRLCDDCFVCRQPVTKLVHVPLGGRQVQAFRTWQSPGLG